MIYAGGGISYLCKVCRHSHEQNLAEMCVQGLYIESQIATFAADQQSHLLRAAAVWTPTGIALEKKNRCTGRHLCVCADIGMDTPAASAGHAPPTGTRSADVFGLLASVLQDSPSNRQAMLSVSGAHAAYLAFKSRDLGLASSRL